MRWLVGLVALLASPAFADGLTMTGVGTVASGASVVVGAVWNTAIQPTKFTYSNSNLTATCNASCGSTGGATSSTLGYTPGSATAKAYFEINTSFTGGSNLYQVGIADATTVGNSNISGAGGIAYDEDGDFTIAGPPPATLPAYASGAVIAYAINWTTKLLWVKAGCAGVWNNNLNAPGEDPATGVGGWPITAGGVNWAPSGVVHIAYSDLVSGNSATINDGSTAFTCTVPTGYLPW